MARVLLVDDDETALDTFALGMRQAGLDVYTAGSGLAALDVFDRVHPSAAAIDLRLPDISGLEVIRRLRHRSDACSFVLVTAFASTKAVVEAMRLGAFDCLEKPVDIDQLTQTMRFLATQDEESPVHPGDLASTHVSHATRRWANLVVRLIPSPDDARTLKEWGRRVGASSGTIRNWCRTVGLSPKHSLDFARVLRAVVRYRAKECAIPDLLNVVDLRTLDRLLALGRPPVRTRRELPVDVDAYLDQQQWIRSATALQTLKDVLRSSGYASSSPGDVSTPLDDDVR